MARKLKGKTSEQHLWFATLTRNVRLSILTPSRNLVTAAKKADELVGPNSDYYDHEVMSLTYEGTIDA